MTSLPLFGHTEAALGDFSFEGGNYLQMKKFKLFQKLDRNTFPMSHLGLNVAKGKASKSGWKAALCFWIMARKSNFRLLSLQVDFLSLFMDDFMIEINDLACKFNS